MIYAANLLHIHHNYTALCSETKVHHCPIMHNNMFYFIACVVLKLTYWSLTTEMITLIRVKPICPTKLLLIIKCLESRKILKNKFDGAICLADFPGWSHVAIMSHFMLSVIQLLQRSIYFLSFFQVTFHFMWFWKCRLTEESCVM